MGKLLAEFMRLWRELSEENKKSVLDYARRLLVNQHIKQNREPE